MKHILFTTTLLFLLTIVVAANGQERGDGTAQNGTVEDPGIVTGRAGSTGKGVIVGHRGSSNPWFNKNLEQQNSGSGTTNKRPFIKGITDFGIKLGANFQEIGTSPFQQQYTPGIVGGLYVRRFYRVTAFKIEVLCSSAHYESSQPAGYYASHASDSVSKSSFSAKYISVPAMFELRLYHNIYIEAGAQYSTLISYSDKNGAFKKIYGKDDIFFKPEFSGLGGIEANLRGKLKIDVRYIKGITDVNNSVYPKAYLQWQINSIQATLSYRLY